MSSTFGCYGPKLRQTLSRDGNCIYIFIIVTIVLIIIQIYIHVCMHTCARLPIEDRAAQNCIDMHPYWYPLCVQMDHAKQPLLANDPLPQKASPPLQRVDGRQSALARCNGRTRR